MGLWQRGTSALRFGRDIGLATAAALRTAGQPPPAPPPGGAEATAPPPVHFLLEGAPPHGLSPAARYRAFQYAPLLERLGHRCAFWPARPAKYFSAAPGFQRAYARTPRLAMLYAHAQLWRQRRNRLRDFRAIAGDGVAFVQRDLLAVADDRLETMLPLWNRHIVFDFDDAIFTLPPWVRGADDPAHRAAMERKLARMCARASVVIAANEHLAAFARAHNPAVRVVPTSLCTEEFSPPPLPPRNAVPVVGWIGTSGNLFYLRQLAPALRALAERRPFVLRVICNEVPDHELGDLPRDRLDFVPWRADGEVGRIQRLDVGIMPLQDDDWSRGKAGFKLIQYMACGLPFVASPVGANPAVGGADGDCGHYATSAADWTDALDRLLGDPDLRARLGQQGRARAVQRFDRAVHAPAIAQAIAEAAGA